MRIGRRGTRWPIIVVLVYAPVALAWLASNAASAAPASRASGEHRIADASPSPSPSPTEPTPTPSESATPTPSDTPTTHSPKPKPTQPAPSPTRGSSTTVARPSSPAPSASSPSPSTSSSFDFQTLPTLSPGATPASVRGDSSPAAGKNMTGVWIAAAALPLLAGAAFVVYRRFLAEPL